MKTVETTYHGPTDCRGSRIIATDCGDHRIVCGYNFAINMEPNHAAAAIALCKKLGWAGTLQGGHTKHGMVWAFIDKGNQIKVKAAKASTHP